MSQNALPNRGNAALLNYYGFLNEDGWPIDGDGVIHLLGDGHPERHSAVGIYELVKNQGEAYTAAGEHITYEVLWVEVLRARGFPVGRFSYVYRIIDRPTADAFDPTSDGFDARDFTTADARDYYRNTGPWYDYETSEPVDMNGGSDLFLGYQAGQSDPIWAQLGNGLNASNGLSHYGNDFADHYWNPYNASIFFTRYGASSNYWVWAPFIAQAEYSGGGFSVARPYWAYKVTTAPWNTVTPPWSPAEIKAHLDDPNPPSGWTFPHAWATDPDVVAIHYSTVDELFAARCVEQRIKGTIEPPVVLYEGTRGGLVNLTESTSTAAVVRQYENGTEVAEGSIPSRVISMTTREADNDASLPVDGYVGHDPFFQTHGVYPMGGVRLNYRQQGELHDTNYPFWSHISGRYSADSTNKSYALCAFMRREAWNITVGWGIAQFDGLTPTLLEDTFVDVMPLRATGRDLALTAEEITECGIGPSPGDGWQVYYDNEENPVGYLTTAATPFRFTALLSDDGDLHDPRANTATATVEAFLALGDGLCYEGELGSIPRPRSGATGTLLGREIVGDADYAVDVMPLPNKAGFMAVMAKGNTIEAWTLVGGVTTLVWTGTLAQSIPLPVLALLDPDIPPSMDLRFLLDDWPTPTGVLTLGGWSLIVMPRWPEHTPYSWVVNDHANSPPFTIHPGWPAAERFPDIDPRRRIVIDRGDDGGGAT